jgi:hypothetical protein
MKAKPNDLLFETKSLLEILTSDEDSEEVQITRTLSSPYSKILIKMFK